MRLVSVPLESEKRIKLNVGFNVLGFNNQKNMFFVEVDERNHKESIFYYIFMIMIIYHPTKINFLLELEMKQLCI